MKKKVLLSIGISLIAIVLIAFVVMISIIYSVDLNSSIDFTGKEYNKSFDTTRDHYLNVASYNVKSGYNTKQNLMAIRRQILDKDIDIAGLQEIDSDDMLRSRDLKCISTLASGEYKHHFFAPTSSLFLRDNYGIMTMAKTPLRESKRLFLPMPNRMFMFVGEPRVCVRTVVNVDGVEVAFYNTHLSFENGYKMPNKEEMRIAQIKYIRSVMDKDPCAYKVLVGDFNILGFGELSTLTKDGKYKMVNNKDTKYNSYRGDDVTFKCLDNIIYTSNMTLMESDMISNSLSDHNMLYARFKI